MEAELSHPVVRKDLHAVMRSEFPDRPDLHLPATTMRRHHFVYARDSDRLEQAIRIVKDATESGS